MLRAELLRQRLHQAVLQHLRSRQHRKFPDVAAISLNRRAACQAHPLPQDFQAILWHARACKTLSHCGSTYKQWGHQPQNSSS